MLLKGELNRLRIFFRPFIIRKYLKTHPDPKLHIGCGSKMFEGWLNVDKFYPLADIYLNANTKLPFAEKTFKYIFLQHLIEHIPTDKVPFFYRSCFESCGQGGL